MHSQVSAAPVLEGEVWYFGSLHPAFEMSCDIEYLEKQLLIFLETCFSSFCIVCNCFDDFRTNLPKVIGQFHGKENTNFPKRRCVRSKNVCLISALLFLWLELKNLFREVPQISLLETIRVFCSNAESRLGCAGCRKLRLLMGIKSWIWDMQYQVLKKQFFIFWKRGLHSFGLCTFFLKVSVQIFEKCRPMSPKPNNIPLKMTLRAAQSLRFQLCLACFSSCEWKSCWEKFERLMFVN